MAEASTNLKVRIGADLREFNRALGGLRSTLGALKGAFAGALAGVSLGGAVAAIVSATAEAERVTAQLEARLKSTGGAAGLAKGELLEMASGLQKVTTFGDEAIISTQSMLLTFTKIGREVFPQALEAVLNLSVGMGTDLNSAAVQVGKALNDPVRGVTALSKAGVQFTKAQRDTIKALVDIGRSAEAQRIILGELETQFGGAARAARNTLGGAFTALKEAAGDLLEGDSGSLTGVRSSIEALISTLQDPAVKQGFADIVNGLAQVANVAAQAIPKLIEFNNKLEVGLGLRANKNGNRQATAVDFVQGSVVALKALVRGDLAGFRAGDARASAGFLGGEVANFGNVVGSPDFSNVEGRSRSSGPAGSVVQLGEDADKAKAKVAALRREQERLRKEAERAEDAQRKELEQLDARVSAGLRDVEIALARASGDEAKAAFMEIDDRWAQLLSDLKAKGSQAGEEMLNRLISSQKAEARFAEVRRAFERQLVNLREPVNAAGDAVTDEAELQAARERALATLSASRAEAARLMLTLSGPAKDAALDGLREMDAALAGLKEGFAAVSVQTADLAIAALGDLFFNLATGASSFKDAFTEAVSSFAKGLARMASEAAATVLILKAFDAFVPGFSKFFLAMRGGSAFKFHRGGVVGAGGSVLNNVSPLLFGAAPRYHSGGIAGLAPNEVPAILERGEEVLTARDPRHARNGGRSKGNSIKVEIHNNTPVQARTEETTGADGGRVLKVIIDAAVNEFGRQIQGNTGVGKMLTQRYGLKPVGVSRG